MKINDDQWFFCELCDTMSYTFECCGNTACNGGGCDKCGELWKEVWEKIHAGDHPPQESVRFVPKELS